MNRYIALFITVFLVTACTKKNAEQESPDLIENKSSKAIWKEQMSKVQINNLSYKEANEILQKSYLNSEHRGYTSKSIKFEKKHNFTEKEDCYMHDGAIELITITNESGVIQRIIPDINNEKSRCYIKLLVGKQFPEPPYAPFFDAWMM